MKNILDKVDKQKENIKWKIMKTFTEVWNTLNNRENELLEEIDKIYISLKKINKFKLEMLKNSTSLNLSNKDHISSNEVGLERIYNLIEVQKMKGHKYPLLACIFLLFREAGKETLKKSELYELMEKASQKDENKIISSPTERYCTINPTNYKYRIKDIIKNKRYFTRRMDENGKFEYSLNEGSALAAIPKIVKYLDIIEKREYIFQSKAKELIDSMEYKSKKEKMLQKANKDKNEEDENFELDSTSVLKQEKELKEKKEEKKEEKEKKEGENENNKFINMGNDITIFKDISKPKKGKESKSKNLNNIQIFNKKPKNEKILKGLSNTIEAEENNLDDDFDIIVEEEGLDKKKVSNKKNLEKEMDFLSEKENKFEEENSSPKNDSENMILSDSNIDNSNNNNDSNSSSNKTKYLNKKRNPSKPKNNNTHIN